APAAEAAPAPAAEAAPAPAAEAAPAPAPAAEAAPAPAPAAEAAPPAPAPAPAPAEHKEISLDQETFDRVLAELLEKGTDRRVAEGQARRAAMIAARKKAEG
ncbi:MAG: translation initiation factor IF-2, partial [Actinomycetota bacterium]